MPDCLMVHLFFIENHVKLFIVLSKCCILFQGSFPSNVQQVGTNLVITRADLSDSGIYLCHVNTSRHVSYKVLLITVGKNTHGVFIMFFL